MGFSREKSIARVDVICSPQITKHFDEAGLPKEIYLEDSSQEENRYKKIEEDRSRRHRSKSPSLSVGGVTPESDTSSILPTI